MKWEYLPKEIQHKMLERQAEQNNGFADATIFIEHIEADVDEGGFSWNKAPEEDDFWPDVVCYKNFDRFYEKYPKEEPKVKVMDPCIVTSERLADEDKIWYSDVIYLGFEIESLQDNVYFKKYGFDYETVFLECPKGISFDYERENPSQVKMIRSDEDGNIIDKMVITSLKELKSLVKFFKTKKEIMKRILTKKERQKAFNRQKLYNCIEEMFELNYDDKKELKEWFICWLIFSSIYAIILYLFLYS